MPKAKRKAKAPAMPTTARRIRQLLKEPNIQVRLTPACRMTVISLLPAQVGSIKEVGLFMDIRRALQFSEAEEEKYAGGDLYDFDDDAQDVPFSVEQLELVMAQFKALAKEKKLPNTRAFFEAYEALEEALEGSGDGETDDA